MKENEFKSIKKVFDEMGLKSEINNKSAFVEFWTHTANQDVAIEIDYDGTIDDFVSEFTKYVDSYDIDEEVEIYSVNRGKNGIPSSIRTILENCEEVKETLDKINDKLSKTLDKIKVKPKCQIYTVTQVHSVSIDILAESEEQALSWAQIHNIAAEVHNYAEDWDEHISDVKENDENYAIDLTEE